MRKFWGFYDNGTYRVGCNGGSVSVFDQSDRELGRFRDMKYAYCGAFQPGTNVFVAKSTEGSLSAYDLPRMACVGKIVITRMGAQDEGFAFSPDGTLFYNIEKPKDSCKTRLTAYRMPDLSAKTVYFDGEASMVLDSIEYDSGVCYVLGFMRAKSGDDNNHHFVGVFSDGAVSDVRSLCEGDFSYIQAFKIWERFGFTKKVLDIHVVKSFPEGLHISLRQVHDALANGGGGALWPGVYEAWMRRYIADSDADIAPEDA